MNGWENFFIAEVILSFLVAFMDAWVLLVEINR